MELLNRQHRRNVPAVLTVDILLRISGQCRHQTDNITLLVCLGRMSATWPHSNNTVFARINTIWSVVMSGCIVQIQVKLSVVAISVSQTDSIAVAGKW